MNRFIKAKLIAISLLSAVLAAGCSLGSSGTADSGAAQTADAEAQSSGSAGNLASADAAGQADFDDDDALTTWREDSSTEIALRTSDVKIDGSGTTAEGGIVTITEAGTYVVSGTLTEGQIVIDAPEDAVVHLVLNGAAIRNDDGPAIYVKEADKTVVTLQDGTDNAVSDGAVYTDTSEDAPSAAFFSEGDLTINGTGELTVQGNANDGITGKDDLKIMSGTINVKAADDGVIGRDLFAVKDGTVTVNAGGDGVKTTNDTDTDRGYVAVTGGTFTITSANDGIQAASSILIGAGSFDIVSGGGSAASTITHQEERGFGGPPQELAEEKTESDDTESSSAKALRAAADIAIADGRFEIDAADDAIHSNANISIMGGQYTIASGDDGVHGGTALSISNGIIDIGKSYEGIESADIAISGGEIHLAASDDGVNVGGGKDDSKLDGGDGSGGDGKGTSAPTDGVLAISGGYLYVDAAGDGLDSNGSIVMSGGTAIVNGPTNAGNGILDYDGTFEQTGGYLIGAGSTGRNQVPSEDSTQLSILMTFPSTLEAGTWLTLTDSSGKAIATFRPAKTFSSFVISSPDLKSGEEYAISTGGMPGGNVTDGLYEGGSISGSVKVVTFKLGDTVTYVDESGVTTAPAGGTGGGHGPGGSPRGN